MRLATVRTACGPQLAFECEGGFYTFRDAAAAVRRDARGPDEIHSLIEGGAPALDRARDIISLFRAAGLPAEAYPEAALLAPIPRPRKNIFCVGKNYADHAAERGSEPPRHPIFFTKVPTAVVGPGARVPVPPQTTRFDYEGELAVIIGRKGKDIPASRAYEHVFGYTIVNDLTARDLQERHRQYFKGKSLDGSCPMGPVIVTADELAELSSLEIETRVNGELRQSAAVSQMLFDVATLISVLSDGMTLEPGDILATGTPAGVGDASGRYLQPGDVVEVRVSGIGSLATYIV